MASSVAAFFSSVFLPEPLHNDAAGPEPDSKPDAVDEADASEVGEVEPEEEEAEPQDPAPGIREECAATAACAPFNHHFVHCTEKVTEGKGYPHEDCVEELCIVMHCVDNCLASRLFSKLS
ncbi:hypothetical protein BS47DRAFT_1303989 [Hydnum rufescens UP504]|uniref:Ubiquinol-cytochrome C reductase hinge domain-containing protein n=1 Tax=Hydnum rufescens UP504 TaxID=1448309 RepID=A0A9P6AME6_9AGAM|nr:hypothetical protein BS47DRAFT_1303989 [Hydnum rufescens UP504]